MQRLNEKLALSISGKILTDEPLAKYTTFKIGGPADILIIPDSIKDLISALKIVREENIPFFVMGNGSNLLISDEGVRGAVIRIAGTMDNIEVKGDVVTAGAGAYLKRMILACSRSELSGLEFFAGIPAALGGAIAMNMGTLGVSIGDNILSVKTLQKDGKIKKYSRDECLFSYRKSVFKDNKDIIIEAELKLIKGSSSDILEHADGFLKLKAMSQPVGMRCAGCIFKNPDKEKTKSINLSGSVAISAGELIERANLKGESIGGAKVSDIHANFIVNTGGATAADVIALTNRIKGIVFEKFGIQLELEVELVGLKSL